MILGIYGAGGLGRECADIARKNAKYEDIVFIDDTKTNGMIVDGLKTFTYDRFYNDIGKDNSEVIIAVGEPINREKLFNKLKQDDIKVGTLISNNALLSDNCIIGEGCIVCEFATIHTGVKLGNNVLIQPQAVIGHDIIIGNHSVLSAYFSPGGSAIFGYRVYAGMHSVVKEKLRIGNDVIIGMGAVVNRDVNDGDTVVGNPARVTLGNVDHKVFY